MGLFEIRNIVPGIYGLSLSAVGYYSKEIGKVEVRAGEGKKVKVRMQVNPNPVELYIHGGDGDSAGVGRR